MIGLPLDYAKVYNHEEIVDFLTSRCKKQLYLRRDYITYLTYYKNIRLLRKVYMRSLRSINQYKYFMVRIVKKLGQKNANNYYGSERGTFEYGTCIVSIPEKKHVKGEIERPKWWKLEFKENSTKHIVLLNINPMLESDFFPALSVKIKESADRK